MKKYLNGVLAGFMLVTSFALLGATKLHAAGTSCVPAYGQCGGKGWTGPTTCCSGTACVWTIPVYYANCLPSAGGPASLSR